MKITKTILMAAAAALLFSCASTAQTATDDRLKDEMGLKRLIAAYPEPGADIAETQPMITVDASLLETPMDPKTVTVELNGADVTDAAEITPAYIVYVPQAPLSPGEYEVRVTAKDVNRADIAPLSWIFTVITEKGAAPRRSEKPSMQAGVPAVRAAPAVTQAPQPALEAADNTTGRLTVSTDYIAADYTPQEAIDISQLFREKEGMKLNADLSFSNISAGRTLIGSYHRETQYYSDVEIDKGRLNYYDDNFRATLGSAWFAISDLTVAGTELNGVTIDKELGPLAINFFSGRTQDPSTSGTFKQLTTGVNGAYRWDDKNTTSLTALTANERNDAVFGLSATPAQDNILSLRHEYTRGQTLKATLELATNMRREGNNPATHDGAAKFTLSGGNDALKASVSAYRIGDDFLPIAEGSAKYLKSNRKGYSAKSDYVISEMFTAGGEYEQYDEMDDDTGPPTTKRGNGYLTVNFDENSRLTVRKSKLTRDDTEKTVSETESVNAAFVLPSTGVLAETRMVLGWQAIDYSSAAARSETKIKMGALSTSYKDILRLSVSHSRSDTADLINLTNSRNKTSTLALNWNIIPFKLMWIGGYELTENSGASADNEETRLKTTLKYVVDKTYTLNIGFDQVSYTDSISHATDYDQSIARTGVEWSF